jgi:hypothetical protein
MKPSEKTLRHRQSNKSRQWLLISPPAHQYTVACSQTPSCPSRPDTESASGPAHPYAGQTPSAHTASARHGASWESCTGRARWSAIERRRAGAGESVRGLGLAFWRDEERIQDGVPVGMVILWRAGGGFCALNGGERWKEGRADVVRFELSGFLGR